LKRFGRGVIAPIIITTIQARTTNYLYFVWREEEHFIRRPQTTTKDQGAQSIINISTTAYVKSFGRVWQQFLVHFSIHYRSLSLSLSLSLFDNQVIKCIYYIGRMGVAGEEALVRCGTVSSYCLQNGYFFTRTHTKSLCGW
jgi:hypothetical protein